ncbi:WD_REPEATS_REGION domain-containing protein [Haematococcus lacustris]|uniref:WD_REPEATS_REGION domain-containing protein n=1 Tax=Haematococcus lacustris TaxID=44745 RepID=A0A699YMD9_HAELA|nr:WD_REPEATS_REGION domain-containing protein [Haematococcus lacustris]
MEGCHTLVLDMRPAQPRATCYSALHECTLADISDRPSLCSAANWGKNEVVVGSSDHALYVIDAEKGTKKRQLYNKSSGHSECVAWPTLQELKPPSTLTLTVQIPRNGST